MLNIFRLELETIRETLFHALIILFRLEKPKYYETYSVPSFIGELTLRISNKILAENKLAKPEELTRTELSTPGGRTRLEEHIFPSNLWDLNVQNFQGYWHWTPPLSNKFCVTQISCERSLDKVAWEQ
jgi:hypothetical protein